jgi:hypothetical protein
MWLTLDDLRCTNCGAFVHPLLDACPSCRAAHASRRDEAAAGPIGAVRLAEAPETQRVARNLTVRYTMKVNAIGKDGSEATLEAAVAHLADALSYRMMGDAVQPTDDAALALRDGGLVAQRRSSGALLAEIPLRVLVGAAARHGEVTLAYAAAPATGAGEAPAGVAGTTGPLFLTVANRRGLLASRARDDHFEALARWLGVLAAAAAERRWMEVGLPAYLAELGPSAGDPVESAAALTPRLDATAPTSATGQIPASSGPPAGEPAPASVQASLVELESLRTAGLVADDEYAAKRQEILARL